MSLLDDYISKKKSVFDDTGKHFIDLERINDWLVEQDDGFRLISPMSMIELDYMWRWFSDVEYSASFIVVNEDSLKEFCEWLSKQNKGEI